MLNIFYFSAKLTKFIMSNNLITVVMKTFTKYFKKSFSLILTLFSVLLFISCGTHNNNDYEADGIYSTEKAIIVEKDTSAIDEDKSNYYKQYFKTKELTYKDVPEEDAIFTDIDAYHTTESLDEDGYVVTEENDYEEEYGAWGNNCTEVSINVYGSYGYSPYYYGGYWGFSYGWGYPYYGWGYPYYSYGWGYPYYGYGWGYPFYGYGYGYGYAYNRGRRNTDYYAGRTAYRGNNRRSYSSSRRGTYSRSESNRRSTLIGNNTRPSSTRPSSTRPSSTRPSSTRPSSTRPSSTRPSSTRPSSTRPSSTRPSSTRPSSNSSSVNRKSSTRRSSNNARTNSSSRSSSYRSSGSSSRSSRGRRGGR